MSIYFRFFSSNHRYQDGIKKNVIVITAKVNMDVNIAICGGSLPHIQWIYSKLLVPITEVPFKNKIFQNPDFGGKTTFYECFN